VEVRIRHIAAKCRCGGTDFEPTAKPPYRLDALFICSSCGQQASYGELLDSIGAEAIRQAREALDALKKKGERT
jgi:hypothetical protein